MSGHNAQKGAFAHLQLVSQLLHYIHCRTWRKWSLLHQLSRRGLRLWELRVHKRVRAVSLAYTLINRILIVVVPSAQRLRHSCVSQQPLSVRHVCCITGLQSLAPHTSSTPPQISRCLPKQNKVGARSRIPRSKSGWASASLASFSPCFSCFLFFFSSLCRAPLKCDFASRSVMQ
ncbi:hypothetical protein HDV57DRAFT_382753 [Trichoderma longibrachiatum]